MIHCFVFGKSARTKMSPKLGCFFRDRMGVAGPEKTKKGTEKF